MVGRVFWQTPPVHVPRDWEHRTRGLIEQMTRQSVPELIETAMIPFDFNRSDVEQTIAACEFVLEGLYAENKISRNEEGGYTAVTKAKKDRRGMIYDDLTETGRYS